MTVANGQTPHPPVVDNFVVAHLLPPIGRISKDTLPAGCFAPGAPFPSTSFISGAGFQPLRMTAVNNLGFFCKEEISIQRTLRIPIFFRLGSLEYCNKLEGK